MSKRYHVAHESYSEHDDLLSYSELLARGVELEYKWEDYIDTDVICMFGDIDDARNFKSEWLPTGKIVEINVPDDDFTGWGLSLVTVEEGYEAIERRIPSKFLRIID